jgi:multiple sugar transport system permease protein
MFKPTLTGRLLLHIANLMVIVFILLPLVAVFFASIQSEKALHADTRRVVPLEFTLDNFMVILSKGQQKGRIFEQATYLPDNIKSFYAAVVNSTVVAASVTFLTLLFGSLSAYTVARQRYRWTLFLVQANIVARFVPVIVLMIPLYIVMRSLGQLNSLTGVIIAETGFLLPFAILILAPYFDSIPAELEEAARIDGCTRIGAFVRVVLPLATPALAACGVIMFIASWHELLIPLILNARPDFMTLPVIIATLVGDVFVFFNLMMAICLLALLPTVILVGLLQKYVVQGLEWSPAPQRQSSRN